jgi:hypothetical protein
VSSCFLIGCLGKEGEQRLLTGCHGKEGRKIATELDKDNAY